MDTTCTVEGCDAPRVKREWCGRHYQRWYTHGDPAYVRPGSEVCTIEDCGLKSRSRASGLCEKHYIRRYRHGDPLYVADTRLPLVKYRAAHARHQADQGKASSFACVDCGMQAHHWSYDHTDPDELWSDTGQPYSLDSSHYKPRCRSCHALADGTGWNQFSGPRPRRP